MICVCHLCMQLLDLISTHSYFGQTSHGQKTDTDLLIQCIVIHVNNVFIYNTSRLLLLTTYIYKITYFYKYVYRIYELGNPKKY